MIGMQIFWALFIVVAIIVEVFTAGLVSIWFVPSALIALILTMFEVSATVQTVVFVVLSALLIFLFKFVFKNALSKKNVKLNLDAVIGEKGVVIDKIHNIAGSGQVKVHNQVWSARSSDPDKTFEVGDVVSVVAIEGVKLICK